MTAQLRFLLKRALAGSESLPPDERALLYEGICQVTSGQAQREAGRMAFWHRTLVTQQQDFLSALFGENE